MLKVEQVSCGYQQGDIVRNVSFEVSAGEKLSIAGPNGCGKTTLLKAIVGILPYEGEITVDGVSLRQMKRKHVAQKIAFMSQSNPVYFPYTVYETVMLGRYAQTEKAVFAKSTRTDEAFVENCLQTVGIDKLRNRSITELSGGELQRVFLAKTFAQDPSIIILDEPTNHLDLRYQIEIMQHLSEWVKQDRRAVVAVLHDINLALAFSDKMLLLSQGELAAYDDKAAILKHGAFNPVYGLDVQRYMLQSFRQWDV